MEPVDTTPQGAPPRAATRTADQLHKKLLRSEALAWLRRLHSGEATAEDAAAMERWRATSPAHTAEFAEASLLWTVLGEAARQAERDHAAATQPANVVQMDARRSRRGFLIGTAALAASAAGVLIVRPPLDFWPSAGELAADYRTSPGERREVAFQDKVAVELNTRTSLDVRPQLGNSVQLILLSGEAAITSRTSDALVVHAGHGQVAASRATFNIRKDGSEVRVACVDGRVDVVCRGNTVALGVAQQLTYDAQGTGAVVHIDPDMITAWRRGILMFQRVPLSKVVEEVNRYRPGRVVLLDPTLGERQVIATFRLERIDDVIDFMSAAMNLKIRSLPGGIVLVG